MIEDFVPYADTRGRAALAVLGRPEAYPGLEPLDRTDIVLRLFRFNGLGEYIVWVVARRPDGYLVRRIVWDRARSHRPGELEPVTFGSDSHIPAGSMERHLRALRSISVRPFLTDDRIGLDGVTFGIQCGDSPTTVRLSWWSDAPNEWRALEAWYGETVGDLEAALPRRT